MLEDVIRDLKDSVMYKEKRLEVMQDFREYFEERKINEITKEIKTLKAAISLLEKEKA